MSLNATMGASAAGGEPAAPLRRELIAIARRHSRMLCAFASLLLAANLWVWGLGYNAVLEAAYSIPDGGGYCALSDSGVSRTIRHNGSVILPQSRGGSYCCGFTFTVAMQVAKERGLLKDKSVAQIRHFQKVWYGSLKGSEARQCVQAVEELGIGRQVSLKDAKPGDFVVFYRKSGYGHSVIFLGWMRNRDGKVVGLRYRSSQPSSQGVGDGIEYFADTSYGMDNAAIVRESCVVARLGRRWWSWLLYPVSS